MFMKILISAASMIVSATSAQAAEVDKLYAVQDYVNKNVTYKPDAYGQDIWKEAKKYGDCEDLAILKRNLLIAKGWDPDDLKIIIVVKNIPGRGKTEYEGHVILKSVQFNMVLDMPEVKNTPNTRTRSVAYLNPIEYDQYMNSRKYKFFCIVEDFKTPTVFNVSERCKKRS